MPRRPDAPRPGGAVPMFSDHLRAKDWTFTATSRAAQQRREVALYLLIASLGMFFAAGLVGYILIRLGPAHDLPDVRLPAVLWLSTALAIGGSAALWRALRSVRRERQTLFRRQLVLAFLLGAGFCATQSVGLSIVLSEHLAALPERPATPEPTVQPAPGTVIPSLLPEELREALPALQDDRAVGARPERSVRLEGLVFMLILLHAVHFVAGMMALTIVTWRGLAGRYDHEYHGGVKLCALYWRFLDVVWIALFGTFLLMP
jgi:cytochrome c oxidase subunit 3